MGSIKLKAERPKLKDALIGGLLTCFMLFAFGFQPAKAQSFDEWFNQKKTQIKYLTEQISALQSCESGLRQGYNMMKAEWGAIGNFKNGEFGLHTDYYNSLSAVNPVVKNSVNLSTIQAEQQSMVSQFNAVSGLSGLTTDEQSYIASVRQNIINQCNKDLDDLQTVLTAGQLEMSDDERIKRLSQITAAIKDKYVFTYSFTSQVKILATQRKQETGFNSTLNQLYESN